MNELANSLIDSSVQCWSCGLFDNLFQIVSSATGEAYTYLTRLCLIVFCVMFSAIVANAVYQNLKSDNPDPLYTKSIKKMILNSLVVLSLLGLGVMVPRMITMVTFEPAATMTEAYTQALTMQTPDSVDARVEYTPQPMADTGMFRPELRDTVIMIMKTTITQFQSFMKLGVAVMDSAFTWESLLGIGALIKHIGLFIVGLYLFYAFGKLFIRFCFKFVDVIAAMAFFAFLFPFSLTMMAFDGVEHIPDNIKKIQATEVKSQVKKLINAIVTLGSCVFTYIVMMTVIAKFLSDPGESNMELMEKILSGQVFEADLSDDNLEALTLMSTIVLVYVLNFMYKQIPEITKMVFGVFDVSEEGKLGEQAADDAIKLTKNVIDTAVSVGKTIISGGEDKKKE